MIYTRCLLAGLLLVSFVPVASAQVTTDQSQKTTSGKAAQPQKNPQQKRRNPAFVPVEEDPALPRVLLLGDSISIGYTLPLREELSGKANLVRPAMNCQYSKNGIGKLDKWLGDKPWDVIHFNFGLHDIKHVIEGSQLVSLDTEGCHRLETEEGYEANMREIVAKLKKTGAALIWCSTTPVPDGAKGRIPGDAARYNEIARRVMEENDVAINDLFKMATPRLDEIQRKADVHFTKAGSQELAKMLAPLIIEKLKTKSDSK